MACGLLNINSLNSRKKRSLALLKQTDIYIPKALASYALTNKCDQQLKLYEYLKMSCSGKRRISKPFVKKACKTLNISRSTFYRHLQWLKAKGWVCKSTRSDLYFIISHKRLLKKEGLEGRTVCYFISSWFSSFKAFLSGCVIGYLCKHQRKAERKKGRSNKLCPVATSALAKILSIPESTAYLLKKKASTNGFITKVFNYIDTGIQSKYYPQVKKYYNGNIRSHKGMLVICKPDLCSENLRYKTHRSL